MNITARNPSGNSLFELGFEHGAEAVEDPSVVEFQSRVRAYQLGFLVGRSLAEAVKQASHQAAATTAGQLGARFAIDVEELLMALSLSDAQKQQIRSAYTQSAPS
jgi:predicted O-linked N-acetylglucosamine transferase (SPINDLY family)